MRKSENGERLSLEGGIRKEQIKLMAILDFRHFSALQAILCYHQLLGYL